jgi:hypothetical protein
MVGKHVNRLWGFIKWSLLVAIFNIFLNKWDYIFLVFFNANILFAALRREGLKKKA